jgi:hypothetical protein
MAAEVHDTDQQYTALRSFASLGLLNAELTFQKTPQMMHHSKDHDDRRMIRLSFRVTAECNATINADELTLVISKPSCHFSKVHTYAMNQQMHIRKIQTNCQIS